MGWTKQEVVVKAFSQAGIAQDENDITPEELFDGMTSLDAMMAKLDEDGIHLRYPIPSNPTQGNLSDDSRIPTYALEAIYMNLAIRLAAPLGRQLLPKFLQMAADGLARLSALKTKPSSYKTPSGTPAGMGNRRTGRRFLQEDDDTIGDGTGSELEIK
jgi:hypothetical protein